MTFYLKYIDKNSANRLLLFLYGIINIVSCIFTFSILSDFNILGGFIPLFEPVNIVILILMVSMPLILLGRVKKEGINIAIKYFIIILIWVITAAIFILAVAYLTTNKVSSVLWSDKIKNIVSWGGRNTGYTHYLINPVIGFLLHLVVLLSAYVSLKADKKIKTIILALPPVIVYIIAFGMLYSNPPGFIG